MLWSRWIKKDEDFATFQTEFERRAGNPLNKDYLRSAKVRGYFTSAGEMVAGFIISTTPPFRYFNWLAPEERRPRPSDRVGVDDFVEVTCIWMKKGRIHAFERGQIYTESIALAALTGKKAMLGGTFVEKVMHQQMQVMRYPFREGVSDFRGERCRYWLYYGNCRLALPLLVKQMIDYSFEAGKRHHRQLARRFLAAAGQKASDSLGKK